MFSDINIGTKMPEKVMFSIETEWISFLLLLKSFGHFVLRARQFLIEESDGKTIYLEDWWSLTSSDNNEWPKKRPLKKALSERDVQLAAAMGLHDKWIEDPCGFSFSFALADVVSHRL